MFCAKVATNSVTTSLLAPQATAVTDDVIAPPVSLINTIESPAVELAPATSNSRKWVGRRRPQFTSRVNPAAARYEACDKIGALADLKREYYNEKLEMRRKEHEQRMKILHLKEQQLKQQIGEDRMYDEE